MSSLKPKRNKKILTSRNYVHVECGEVTTIEGPEFKATANPLNEIVQTQCAHCGYMDCISQYSWEDTGENLAEYIARYRENVPEDVLEKCGHSAVIRRLIIGGILGAVAGLFIGVGIGFASKLLWGVVGGILAVLVMIPVGVLTYAMHHEKTYAQPMFEKYLGVKEVGELR